MIKAKKIPPLGREIRDALVQLYCPSTLQEEAREMKRDKYCLLRVYLGRRRRNSGRPNRFFSLKDFPLCLDQIEEIGLDMGDFVKGMAGMLTALHWGIGVDGRDVEFVLGGERGDGNVQGEAVARLWLLDFNQCRKVGRDEDGVRECMDAFWVNDPYYPRPNRKGGGNGDRKLWDSFRREYLNAVELIDGEEAMRWGRLFVEGVDQRSS